jgi:hypothetical protein
MKKIDVRFEATSIKLKKKAKKDYGIIISTRVSKEVED